MPFIDAVGRGLRLSDVESVDRASERLEGGLDDRLGIHRSQLLQSSGNVLGEQLGRLVARCEANIVLGDGSGIDLNPTVLFVQELGPGVRIARANDEFTVPLLEFRGDGSGDDSGGDALRASEDGECPSVVAANSRRAGLKPSYENVIFPRLDREFRFVGMASTQIGNGRSREIGPGTVSLGESPREPS